MSLSNKFKSILLSQAEQLPNNVAICLSGGIDSVALLFALRSVDKEVTAYSFTLDSFESRDYKIANQLAELFNIRFIGIKLPTNIEVLKSDVNILHDCLRCEKKTEYECVWPFIYVYPKITESVIVTGLGAEGNFGTTKQCAINFKDNLDEFRKIFFSTPNVSQINQHNKLANKYLKSLWFPFLTPEVRNCFVGTDWDSINKPHLKQVILDAFYDEFDSLPVTLKSSNLQLDSGIAKHFDKLLKTNWNTNNYKSVVGIFNQINKGMYNGKRKLI